MRQRRRRGPVERRVRGLLVGVIFLLCGCTVAAVCAGVFLDSKWLLGLLGVMFPLLGLAGFLAVRGLPAAREADREERALHRNPMQEHVMRMMRDPDARMLAAARQAVREILRDEGGVL